jgi:hypothetical protein
MKVHSAIRRVDRYGVLYTLILLFALIHQASAKQFTLNGVTLDLQEVTTNVSVYFSSMRLNRAANEWDVNVAVSNNVSQTFSGPLILMVDSFTGTSGPLRADGISTNQYFYDLSGEISQGALTPTNGSTPRVIALGYVVGATPKVVTRVFAAMFQTNLQAIAFTRSLNEVGQPLPGVAIQETGPDGNETNMTEGVLGVVTLGRLETNVVIHSGYRCYSLSQAHPSH